MTKRAVAPKQEPPTHIDNELTKGLNYATQANSARDNQDALCLVIKADTQTQSPIARKLRQLGNYLKKKRPSKNKT